MIISFEYYVRRILMFYRVMCEEDYEVINLTDWKYYDYLRDLNGTPKRRSWKNFEVTFERADRHYKKLYSDFPWYMSTVLILRENVVSKMKDFFEANGELLPMHSADNQKLFAFNCFNIIDALDEEKSDLIRLEEPFGKILLVKKLVLKNEDSIHADIFRLKNNISGATYVSDKFIELYSKHNFVGLKFIKYTEKRTPK